MSGRRGYRMKRFQTATSGWRVGAVASVLLAAVALAGPAAAKNTNLPATDKSSSSSDWQSAQGNVDYIADKAFDGDLTNTRWNGLTQTNVGSWLAAQWGSPATVGHVVVPEGLYA